jgi:hypothetical protein
MIVSSDFEQYTKFSSENLVKFCGTTSRYNPEDHTLQVLIYVLRISNMATTQIFAFIL